MRLISRIFALCLPLLPLPAAAQNSDAGVAAMRSRLESEVGYAGVFGVAHGSSLSIAALGDVRSGQPHETGEVFRWASVSKMITAILIFQQVDEGHIALDATVKAYLPDAPIPNADRTTIRHLLAHRSGLAGQADTPAGPPGDLLQYCQATAADPGSTFLYNNCDTIVLGKVLEAVVGEPYLTQVNQRIGALLGFVVALPDEPRVEATMEDGTVEQPAWPSAYGPAGGLYGTVEDLLKVNVALIEGRLISATSLATMLTGDPASGYAALSVWSYSPDLKSCIGKTRLVERYGEIGGVQVRNFLMPDLEIALVIYSNDHRTNFGEVWRGEGLSIDLIRAAVCGAPG
ncbi:serine hydrolase domain-containing protein [Brevundimonas sp.]|uniref:serine hydrolase domain-containing protein n=1 Tax=Brevundimonas sp. TaxID=1871086 RepID=UPI003426FB7E